MKLLSEITAQLQDPVITGNASIMVRSLTMDSRSVSPGALYVAIKGLHADGHNFIADAIANGAGVIVCETLPGEISGEITYVEVKDSATALGLIASVFYGDPSTELTLIGITGTNGKTTIATLLHETFTSLGFRCGLISTIRYHDGIDDTDASHTTPDALRLQQIIRDMVENGCDYCFMEVSSHAVVQKRIAGLTFAGGIFTNLTHDHLDFHPTFDDYLKAKQAFFTSLPKHAFALVSKDDRNGMVMVQQSRARVYTYSTTTMADFHAKVIENTIDGLHLDLGGSRVWFRLTGAFNARNIAAVYGAAMLLQADDQEVLEVLSSLEPVEGRFQQFRGPDGVIAIVDYAHTPDALKNVLETIRDVNREEGRVVTVVGAGGDRDPFKRPLMARIASSFSDHVILTSDNPRTEPPEKILQEMQQGLDSAGKRKSLTITDRREAIRAAVMMATDGDIVLIAGKGHEKYQEINGIRHPFDDMAVVQEAMDQKSINTQDKP
ncbi:MAG: UDP-N-acetylmuramoyl-L-alanyl-D-glutamate--2,6-diaminopimelate ligase [Bacteroidales bacterium]